MVHVINTSSCSLNIWSVAVQTYAIRETLILIAKYLKILLLPGFKIIIIYYYHYHNIFNLTTTNLSPYCFCSGKCKRSASPKKQLDPEEDSKMMSSNNYLVSCLFLKQSLTNLTVFVLWDLQTAILKSRNFLNQWWILVRI